MRRLFATLESLSEFIRGLQDGGVADVCMKALACDVPAT